MFGAIAECDAIEIKASGDFLRGVVLIETSADGVVFHPAAAPIRKLSSQRLNIRPRYVRPRIEGGADSTTIVVSLKAQRAG